MLTQNGQTVNFPAEPETSQVSLNPVGLMRFLPFHKVCLWQFTGTTRQSAPAEKCGLNLFNNVCFGI